MEAKFDTLKSFMIEQHQNVETRLSDKFGQMMFEESSKTRDELRATRDELREIKSMLVNMQAK